VSVSSSVSQRAPQVVPRVRRRRLLGRSEASLLSVPWALWLLLFYAVPLGFILVISFWRTEGTRMVPAFTLHNYQAIFTTDAGQLTILANTLLIAIIVLAASVLVAYPMAYFLAFRVRRLWVKSAILTLIVLPFLVGGLIRTIAWRGVLGIRGVVNEGLQAVGITQQPLEWLLYSKFAVGLALFYNFYPFMLFTVYLVLEAVDRRIIAAAFDLGASRWQTFTRVVFPLSVPGLLTGSILIFVPVASASLEPEILGGASGRFSANGIQAKFFLAFDWPAGAAMAVVFTIASFLIIALLASVLGFRYRRVFAGLVR
jgi:ABC-type spermidine/putrescine transport system permease subunit I